MSTIEWLRSDDGTQGVSWNPVTGCSPQSAGCLNCYAAALASRGMSQDHRGLTTNKKRRNATGKLVNLPVFNGTIRLHPERLEHPLSWRKPRRVFVNSMSDLFHPKVPFVFIAAVFGTMAVADQHTYLVLTKNPRRAAQWYEWIAARTTMFEDSDLPQVENSTLIRTTANLLLRLRGMPCRWPIQNVQLGVSAEDQPNWNARVPELARCPASVHWVSIEPMLGSIRMHGLKGLDWIVVGGESGPGARPFDVEWAEQIVEQCDAEHVPVFVKQLGTHPVRQGKRIALADRKGKEIHEWTGSLEHLQRRELAS